MNNSSSYIQMLPEPYQIATRALERAGIIVDTRQFRRVVIISDRIKAMRDKYPDKVVFARVENHVDRDWSSRKCRTEEERNAECIGYTNSNKKGYCTKRLWLILEVK